MVLGLILLAVALALVIIGVAVKGIFWLAIIGLVLFVVGIGVTALTGSTA